ncbi:MAG: hypothetical protein APR53_08615 [Methanoculleus sp. SDB]|nr:MAG: hypothetical protein APR53_08615 [Methanoculleus sp. SDB]
MVRERIISGDLDTGSGVDGRKKKAVRSRQDTSGEPEETGKKKDFRKPSFKIDSDADIFDSGKP